LPFIGDADVVWGANPNLFSFFPSMIYGAFKHVPVIRNVDDLWPEVFYELGYVKSKFARKMLDLIAWLSYVVPVAITPISEGYKSLIISKYGIPKDKVHVIEVGAETIKLKNVVSDSKSTFTIMYSGVLGLGYDFDVVLRCAKLLDKKVNVTFIIRGSGELAPELKKKIKAFGLKNVVLDARFLPVDELSDLLNSADAFVLPMADLDFVDLGLPTKVFEYQSYGKPIICVSSGEVAKYIRITESGLVVNPKDAKGLAEAVVSLYENSEIVNLLGMNGRKFVTEQLSSEKIGERMCTMFSSINYSKNVCEI
jgi:glycosyltransferase involved in cell wall biosynthesis